MLGRSIIEAIYLLRRTMERYRTYKNNSHLVFIDLKNVYDIVSKEILWKVLEKKEVRIAYIRSIQDMYEGASTSVRTQDEVTNDFPITIGLHKDQS